MSELTRDEILDAHANCNGKCNSFYMPCPLNNIDCEIAIRDAVRSLRDDYNAEVEKNKLLEAEVERLKSAIQTYNSGDVPPNGYSPFNYE